MACQWRREALYGSLEDPITLDDKLFLYALEYVRCGLYGFLGDPTPSWEGIWSLIDEMVSPLIEALTLLGRTSIKLSYNNK